MAKYSDEQLLLAQQRLAFIKNFADGYCKLITGLQDARDYGAMGKAIKDYVDTLKTNLQPVIENPGREYPCSGGEIYCPSTQDCRPPEDCPDYNPEARRE